MASQHIDSGTPSGQGRGKEQHRGQDMNRAIDLTVTPMGRETSEIAMRRAMIAKLRAAGINPYVGRYEVTHTAAEAKKLPDEAVVAIAGRIVLSRDFGKLAFFTLQDRSGRIQFSLKSDTLGADKLKEIQSMIATGDFVGVKGPRWTTKKGEPTVDVQELVLLTKAIRPLPDKWHGVTDTELQYRKRYLDLIANEDSRQRFFTRSHIVSHIRRFLEQQDFVEVETPMLQAAASGASARPFVTHHNALNQDLFLRISPETYLKRLVAGGFDRVYEIGKSFRNEGLDPSHLQEFTMLEWYAAYWNYRDNMRCVETLIKELVERHCGSLQIEYQGVKLDFSGTWPEYDYRDLVQKKTGIDLTKVREVEKLKEEIRTRNINLNADLAPIVSYGALVDLLYKRTVRPELIQPCFLLYHPVELVPLARPSDEDPTRLDMFQVLINTWEVVKAYSELVDPQLQRKFLEEQVALRTQGDDESMMMEEDFIECMEQGMPPISGLGLGIDRITSLLTNQPNLRDVVFFPPVRNET
jgi:lysyl-tRNA synthetase class 2